MSSADQVRTVEEERIIEAEVFSLGASGNPAKRVGDVLRESRKRGRRIEELESLNAILEANLLSFKELTLDNLDMEGQLILVKHIADEATPPWAKLQAALIPGKDLIL